MPIGKGIDCLQTPQPSCAHSLNQPLVLPQTWCGITQQQGGDASQPLIQALCHCFEAFCVVELCYFLIVVKLTFLYRNAMHVHFFECACNKLRRSHVVILILGDILSSPKSASNLVPMITRSCGFTVVFTSLPLPLLRLNQGAS